MQATSGLGAAAAYALSKEGFCVVLGIPIPFSVLYFKSKISFFIEFILCMQLDAPPICYQRYNLCL